jgi:DNA-binding GntR family transcriptional regulator
MELSISSVESTLFAGICDFRAYLERAIARLPLEVVNEESVDRIELLLRLWAKRVGPSARFRRRAWREFQRALDPLAPPKPLPPERA